MNPNDEIVKLAVELAKAVKHTSDILRRHPNTEINALVAIVNMDAVAADRILALAAPPEREPMPWPGIPGEPDLLGQHGGSYYVCQTGNGWCFTGPSRPTRVAAIDAWDEVMKRLAGTGLSAEERRRIATAIDCLRWNKWSANADSLQAILDAHPDGGGA